MHAGDPGRIRAIDPTIVATATRFLRVTHTLEQLQAGQLAGARQLKLACGLTEFPREIFDLADTLEVLDLTGNALSALPDDLPYVTGGIGLLGTKPSNDMMESCDVLLMIGTNFPYSEWLPEPGQARCVQIDIDGRMIGIRYPMEVNLVGDSRETLRALIPLLQRKTDREWREKIEAEVEDWWRLVAERALAKERGKPRGRHIWCARARSQGIVRHRFLRGCHNTSPPPE